MTTGSIIEE